MRRVGWVQGLVVEPMVELIPASIGNMPYLLEKVEHQYYWLWQDAKGIAERAKSAKNSEVEKSFLRFEESSSEAHTVNLFSHRCFSSEFIIQYTAQNDMNLD